MVYLRGRGQLQRIVRKNAYIGEKGVDKKCVPEKGKEPGGVLGVTKSYGDLYPYEGRPFSQKMLRRNGEPEISVRNGRDN